MSADELKSDEIKHLAEFYCKYDKEELLARIAELEALVNVSEGLYERIYEQAARIAELEADNDRLQDAWFKDETICPDGSLKPKVSTLLSRIAELEEKQRWIPVSERLPEDKKHYMTVVMNCFDGSRDVYRLRYYGNGDWFSWSSESNVVTHWKEEPELPEVTE